MFLRILKIVAATGFWCVVVSALWVLLLRFVPPPVTWIMVQSSNTYTDMEGKELPFQRDWTPLSRISRAMPQAVIASEDQRFFHHFGFEWKAIERAMDYNERKKGKRVKGASTITQQTAKNVFCWPGRTFVRKGIEAWFTLLMESLWSKERILEVYLNVAETGRNTFGVEAISNSCFHRPAAQLSNAQAALVAAVLPSPRKFNACAPSGYMLKRQGAIMTQMRMIGDQFDPAVRESTAKRIEQEKRGRRKSR